MGTIIKLVASCLTLVILSLFATGIERIVWMFSGSGLVAVVPQKLYQPFADIQCSQPAIEIKRDPDGVLRYRCGSYWLLAHGGRSAQLTQGWPDIKAQLARQR